MNQKIILCACVMLCSSACVLLPESATRVWNQLSKDWGWGEEVRVSASPSPSASVVEEYSSESARRSKMNAELLQEMVRVVLMKDPTSNSQTRSDFGSMVDSMNQGASLEGVYNGFTHSSEFRDLEKQSKAASTIALRVFSRQMAMLQFEMKQPTQFDVRSAQPLPAPVRVEEGVVNSVEFGLSKPTPQSPSKADVTAIEELHMKTFVGASIFTLKRVLGDEALLLISEKKSNPDRMAAWYGAWIMKMCALHVDFGLELRNKCDEMFHLKWALDASADRLQWEVLNRLHRVMNDADVKRE